MGFRCQLPVVAEWWKVWDVGPKVDNGPCCDSVWWLERISSTGTKQMFINTCQPTLLWRYLSFPRAFTRTCSQEECGESLGIPVCVGCFTSFETSLGLESLLSGADAAVAPPGMCWRPWLCTDAMVKAASGDAPGRRGAWCSVLSSPFSADFSLWTSGYKAHASELMLNCSLQRKGCV